MAWIRYVPILCEEDRDFGKMLDGVVHIDKEKPKIPHFIITISEVEHDPTHLHERPRPPLLQRLAWATGTAIGTFVEELRVGKPRA